MIDYQIMLLLIMKIRFSSAANIPSYLKLEKSLILCNYQFYSQQHKHHTVKTRLIKVNLKCEVKVYWHQRVQKFLCNLQNQAYSEPSLSWKNYSAAIHLHYSQAAYLSLMCNILYHSLFAKVAVETTVGMHPRWVTSLWHGSWWILQVCLH